MSAGLPGVGLSGLFFIASAIVMLPLEIVHTLRGNSSLQRWSVVLRHLAIVIAMLVGLELAYALVYLVVEHLGALASRGPGVTGGHQDSKIRTLPVAPGLAALGLVGCLVFAAKAAHIVSHRARPAFSEQSPEV